MKENFTPKSIEQDIVVQELENEVLVYNLKTNKAFCLNQTAALVWQSCNGSRTIEEISQSVGKQLKSQVKDDLVWLALDELNKNNLIEEQTVLNNKFSGLSRREAVRKIGLAAVIALPLVASLTAPTSALASTSCACVTAGDCTAQTSCPRQNFCNGSGVCAP
jgi:hypothetical protein